MEKALPPNLVIEDPKNSVRMEMLGVASHWRHPEDLESKGRGAA